MDALTLPDDFATAAQQLIDERDSLQSELAYDKSTVSALELQNKRYAVLLKSANITTDDNENTPYDEQWIAGNFLYREAVDIHLADSIIAYREHNSPQRALALLTLKISSADLTDAQRINALLLLTAMMRASSASSSSSDPPSDPILGKALAIADDALETATKIGDLSWVNKVHFHRGLCYLHLNRLADARWSFVLASDAAGYSELAMLQRLCVEAKIDMLSAHERKQLHVSFTSPETSRS